MPDRFRAWFESYGVVVEVVLPDAVHADRLRAMLPIDSVGRPARSDICLELREDATVLRDGSVTGGWPDRELALDELGGLMRRYVAEHSPTHVFVHAGVVGIGSGVIVIPGFSHSGKTTLVAEMVKSGAVYFSDEYAPIDADGRVHPYPQILRTRGRDGRAGTLIDVPPTQVGSAPQPVTLVVETEFRPGASFAPTDGERSEAALALLKHTVSIRRRPASGLAVIARAVARTGFVRSPRGEAGLAASTIIGQRSANRI